MEDKYSVLQCDVVGSVWYGRLAAAEFTPTNRTGPFILGLGGIGQCVPVFNVPLHPQVPNLT